MRPEWRRVSDWKQTIALVDLADVDAKFMEAHGLLPPEETLRPRFPRLARLAATTRFARVEPPIAKLLHEAGIATYEVGYHRGSDGLLFAEESGRGRRSRDVDIARLVERLGDDENDDDAYDRLRRDAVDAVLRVLSEGLLTERAAIVAAAVPPLSAQHEGDAFEERLAESEGLDPGALPDVTAGLVERVASALSEITASPAPPPGPELPPEVRRAYQRKAAIVGFAALTAALLGLAYAPFVAVLALPVLALCLVIIALHAVALRAGTPR